MKSNNKKGFSLIELLAVVLIIGVLAAIAMPMYQKAVLKSRSAEVNNLLTIVRTRQAQNFAKNKKYDENFETRNLIQITKDGSVEANDGIFKTVNDDYELELVNKQVEVNGQTKNMRCVIGRYKPGGHQAEEADFAFAISYTRSGLGCNDSQTAANNIDDTTYSKNICSSFGDVVGTVEDLCEVKDAESAPLEFGNCCEGYELWDFNTKTCKRFDEVPVPLNHYFSGINDGCVRCAYCSGDGCTGDNPNLTQVIKGQSGPAIPDIVFECTDSAAAEGAAAVNGLYQCHSRYYKEWSNEACAWVCPSGAATSSICPEGTEWNANLCICSCPLGSQCNCHQSQIWKITDETSAEGVCECKASNTHKVSDFASCICNARDGYLETSGFRILEDPFTECKCDPSHYKAVFFGTIKRDNQANAVSSLISHEDALEYVQQDPVPYVKAACCNTNDYIANAGSVNGFNYGACCQHTTIKSEGQDTDVHINFNSSTLECCASENPFFTVEVPQGIMDPTYNTRPIGDITGNICHKCQELTNAYDNDYGCYACPGKTFTTWNNSGVSICECPTGTTGNDTITTTTENCQCTKHNTEWQPGIAYVAYEEGQGTGPVGDNVWHATNGACKCKSGFTDTYFGKQMGENDTADVDSSKGYCCPSGYDAYIYDDNNTVVSGQKACCPNDFDYFHNTTFANTSCGRCQNQTDTYVNGQCQPCPEGMYPQFNANLGYSLCYCPQGTQAKAGYQDGIATTENICKCKLDNAEWTLPSGVTNADFVNAYVINNNTSTLSGWSDTHGYCSCKSGYGYSTLGTEADSSGYCCPNPAQNNQLWHQTQDNPQDGYCCSSAVAFNNETGYETCCSYPYYYGLDALASAGLTESNRAGQDQNGQYIDSVATVGGCAPCQNPQYTYNTSTQQCSECANPKIPIWNNDRELGYSTCVCPFGTREEKPSWLQYVGSWFGYEIPEQACYCDIAGTVWSDNEVNGSHCVCYKEDTILSTAFDHKQACCPKDEVFAMPDLSGEYDWDDHHCCPKKQQFFYEDKCHQCPKDKPYYYTPEGSEEPTEDMYNSENIKGFVEKYCHVCPKGEFNYGGTCCPNEIPEANENTTVQVINVVGLGKRCTTGATNASSVSCVDSENGSVVQSVWNEDYAAYMCSCLGEGEYDSVLGCLCQNQCADQGVEVDFSPYFSQATCNCKLPREFNPICCNQGSDADCCKCPSDNYVEFSGKPKDKSKADCCLISDYDASLNACCGQGIAYNETANDCCSEQAPYYDSVKGRCYRCVDGQVWDASANNGQGACVECNAPRIIVPSSWDATLGVYTQCACPQGSGTQGLGGELPGQDSFSDSEKCKCNQAGYYYLNNDYTLATTYGATGASCKQCPGGSSWNPTYHKCQCNTSYNLQPDLVNGQCQCQEGYHLLTADFQSCQFFDESTGCICRQCPAGTNPDPITITIGNTPTIRCARCADNQVWNGSACVSCTAPTIVDTASWAPVSGGNTSNFYAHTSCKCDPATNFVSSGDINRIVPININDNPDKGYNNTATPGVNGCYCPNGTYYLDDNAEGAQYPNGTCHSCSATPGHVEDPYHPGVCVCAQGLDILADGTCGCNSPKALLDPNGQPCNLGDYGCICRDCQRGFTGVNNQCECVSPKYKILATISSGGLSRGQNICQYNESNCYCADNCPTGTHYCPTSQKCICNFDIGGIPMGQTTQEQVSMQSQYASGNPKVTIYLNNTAVASCIYSCDNGATMSNNNNCSGYFCGTLGGECSGNGKPGEGDTCPPTSCPGVCSTDYSITANACSCQEVAGTFIGGGEQQDTCDYPGQQMVNGQCQCPSGQYLLRDDYTACPTNGASDCACRTCPTDRGFSMSNGSCVCVGSKGLIKNNGNNYSLYSQFQNSNAYKAHIGDSDAYCVSVGGSALTYNHGVICKVGGYYGKGMIGNQQDSDNWLKDTYGDYINITFESRSGVTYNSANNYEGAVFANGTGIGVCKLSCSSGQIRGDIASGIKVVTCGKEPCGQDHQCDVKVCSYIDVTTCTSSTGSSWRGPVQNCHCNQADNQDCPTDRGFALNSSGQCICPSGNHIIKKNAMGSLGSGMLSSSMTLNFADGDLETALTDSNYYCGTCGDLVSGSSGCSCHIGGYNNAGFIGRDTSGSVFLMPSTTTSTFQRPAKITLNGGAQITVGSCSYGCGKMSHMEYVNKGTTTGTATIGCAGTYRGAMVCVLNGSTLTSGQSYGKMCQNQDNCTPGCNVAIN